MNAPVECNSAENDFSHESVNIVTMIAFLE